MYKEYYGQSEHFETCLLMPKGESGIVKRVAIRKATIPFFLFCGVA